LHGPSQLASSPSIGASNEAPSFTLPSVPASPLSLFPFDEHAPNHTTPIATIPARARKLMTFILPSARCILRHVVGTPHAISSRSPLELRLRSCKDNGMPSKKTLNRVAKDKRQGKSPSTQAGEFVREEIHHVRDGEHGARSAKQVIAIALSKARRAGVALKPPKRATAAVRAQAARDTKAARTHHKPSRARSRASHAALEHEGTAAASPAALSRHAHAVSAKKKKAHA
jgi:hypothetical protein